MSLPRVHLSGLDSLRWYSALAVIITHVELHKGYHALPNLWSSIWIQNLGPAGVYFFFVLSGFLITWLLQSEQTTSLRNILSGFYRRRAFRILPLYYLLVFLGFAVLPNISLFSTAGGPPPSDQFSEFAAFISGQPHIASAFLQRVPNISHLWSIGVELTFYCFWPLLVLRSTRLERSIIAFIAGMLLIKVAVLVLAPRLLSNPQPLFHLAATLKFECMAIGAWFALPMRNWCRSLLDSPRTVWLAFAAVPPVFLMYGTPLDNVVHLPLAILFGIIIHSAAFSPQSPARYLDNRISRYLGRISYGIYCYHVLCLTLVLNLLSASQPAAPAFNVLLYGGTFLLTIAVSALSFELFELPVARRGRRRRTIPHAPEVRQGASCTSHT